MTRRLLVPSLIALTTTLAAGQRPTGPAADAWSRRVAGAGEYDLVLEVSGRGELGLFLERPPDPQNLQSICDARQEALEVAIATQQEYLKSLLARSEAARDLAEIAWTHRSLGQLWAYVARG
jgi:hypothetical protein